MSRGALHAKDIMVQKRSSFVSLHMLKREKLINAGTDSITHAGSIETQRNPDVLRRFSVVGDKKEGAEGQPYSDGKNIGTGL